MYLSLHVQPLGEQQLTSALLQPTSSQTPWTTAIRIHESKIMGVTSPSATYYFSNALGEVPFTLRCLSLQLRAQPQLTSVLFPLLKRLWDYHRMNILSKRVSLLINPLPANSHVINVHSRLSFRYSLNRMDPCGTVIR